MSARLGAGQEYQLDASLRELASKMDISKNELIRCILRPAVTILRDEDGLRPGLTSDKVVAAAKAATHALQVA